MLDELKETIEHPGKGGASIFLHKTPIKDKDSWTAIVMIGEEKLCTVTHQNAEIALAEASQKLLSLIDSLFDTPLKVMKMPFPPPGSMDPEGL